MFKFKDKIFVLLLIVILMLIGIGKLLDKKGDVNNQEREKKVEIKIKDVKLVAEISDTEEMRFLGLSGRKAMGFDHGMLFIHDKSARYQYVMRGMLFDLDFVFIKDGKVVDVARNVKKEYVGTIQGGEEYDRVLELNAGWLDKNQVEVGDKVVF